MLDPFPFYCPEFLQTTVSKFAPRLNLYTLPAHSHEVLLAFSLYHWICTYFSPPVSRALAGKYYTKLDKRGKLNWDIHVVSFFQSVLICYLSISNILNDKERGDMDYRERVWAYTGGTAMVESLGCGYFLWDLWISLQHVSDFGPGMLAHAISAFTVFSLGFRPFVNFYAPVFLLYEASTPFLNIHWFCDKLDLTGSPIQFYNGILLMASFFGARLVWGVYQTFCVFSDVFRVLSYQETVEGQAWLAKASVAHVVAAVTEKEEIKQMMRYTYSRKVPLWMAIVYLGSNIILSFLNVYWFGQMVTTIRKRFDPPFGTKRPEKEQVVMGRGIDEDGTKSVEMGKSSVKKRGKAFKGGDNPPPT